MAANGLCMIMVEYEQVLWLRLLAGVGAGIYTAVAIAILGASSKPARSFNMLLFFFAFSQAAELYVLPNVINGWHLHGVYWQLYRWDVFLALGSTLRT